MGVGVVLWLLVWLAVFFDSLSSAASVWIVNDTFNHCFLVLPAVLCALWQNKGAILARAPTFSWVGLLAVLGMLFIYALGQAAYVELLQHVAVFGMLPVMVLYLFGWRVVAVIWAPLAFILFSVPVGEELIPLFQDITADMAVAMLKLIGVPVYRDGLYISVSNGNFVVAEACSGVRFFIACVVIGCAYAYLNFVAWWRSLAFLVFSVVMPILANGVRAFGIIYIGHLTEMEHAAGADHLIYGWFFFAIVIVVLILVGFFFSDGQRRLESKVSRVESGWQKRNRKMIISASLLPFVVAIGVKLLVGHPSNINFDLDSAGLQQVDEQQVGAEIWAPQFFGADIYREGANRSNGIHFYQAIYLKNEKGRELVSWKQRLFDLRNWTVKGQYNHSVPNLGTVRVSHLTSLSQPPRLLASWFVVPGRTDSRGPVIKLQQAVNILFMRPSGGALVAVSMPFSGSIDQARDQLGEVLMQRANTLSTPSLSD